MIKIICHKGAPSTSKIGKFLLDNREFFSQKYKFEILRVEPQENYKYIQKYGVRELPFIVVNEKIICNEKNILIYLNDLIKPTVEIQTNNYDDYLVQTNSFKNVNNKIIFDENLDNIEDINYDKKIKEYDDRRKNLPIKPPTKEDVLINNHVDESLNDYDIDYENYLYSEVTNYK